MLRHQVASSSTPLAFLPPCPSSTRAEPLDRGLSDGSAPVCWSRLPAELLVQIFQLLPPLQLSPDRANVCGVCRAWVRPAQTVLWRSLWLASCEAVSALDRALEERPELGKLPRSLRFSTQDDMYLATLDADAVFATMNNLVNLEQFDVFVAYAMGDLYDSLCEELKGSPIKRVMLGADEGIGRRHVQASMRFLGLEFLELIRLGTLGDLDSLELEWIYPQSLVELVLIQPELVGDDLKFLLAHTKGTLRRLRIDFGHLVPGNEEDGTPLTESDLETALLESGANLRRVEIRWPYCTAMFLNEAIKGLFDLQELVTAGPTCDPGEIDRHCLRSLTQVTFDTRAGSNPPESLVRLTEPGGKVSNVVKYHLTTAFEDPKWDSSVPELMLDDGEEPQLERGEWTEASIEEWKQLASRLDKVGVRLTSDFF